MTVKVARNSAYHITQSELIERKCMLSLDALQNMIINFTLSPIKKFKPTFKSKNLNLRLILMVFWTVAHAGNKTMKIYLERFNRNMASSRILEQKHALKRPALVWNFTWWMKKFVPQSFEARLLPPSCLSEIFIFQLNLEQSSAQPS